MDLGTLPDLLRFSVPPLELVLRGTAVYAALLLLFRFGLRRDAGAIGLADILLVVLIADAAQNAMAGDYQTLADGAVLVGTIAGWNMLLDAAAYRWRPLRRLASPAPRVLVRRGALQHEALRHERITEEELLARLREHGIERLAEVKFARLEADGDISVIRSGGEPDDEETASARRRRA